MGAPIFEIAKSKRFSTKFLIETVENRVARSNRLRRSKMAPKHLPKRTLGASWDTPERTRERSWADPDSRVGLQMAHVGAKLAPTWVMGAVLGAPLASRMPSGPLRELPEVLRTCPGPPRERPTRLSGTDFGYMLGLDLFAVVLAEVRQSAN